MIHTPIKVIHKPNRPIAKTDSSLGNDEYFKVQIEIMENNKQKVQNPKYLLINLHYDYYCTGSNKSILHQTVY